MLRRNLIFAILFAFMLTSPLHGTALSEDPCYKLARGLSLLGAEDIHYFGYHFISEERDRLAGQLESIPASLHKAPVLWHLGSGLDQTYAVLKISGRDYKECRAFADSLVAAQGREDWLLGQTWHLETYIQGREEDLAALGLRLVQNLGGELHSIHSYNNTLYLLAYISWPGEVLMLDDGQVNLNLELLYDPVKGAVRLRAGTPVLLTLSHFEE